MLVRTFIAAIVSLVLTLSAQAQPTTLDDLWTVKTGLQVLLGSAVITTVINVMWAVASSGIRGMKHWWNASTTTYPVLFSRDMTRAKFESLRGALEGFSVLLIRYGTDQYLNTLASDQEKHEGRLKNEVMPIKIRFDPAGGARFTLRLPVHKRLGTQFKCFAAAKGDGGVERVVEFLKACDSVKDVQVSRSVKANRVYFLLDRFDRITTVDNHTNNMIYPE